MTWEEIVTKLDAAKAYFLAADSELLTVNANERSMTHRFAVYLQSEFPDWNVDCEYNRKGTAPKRLRVTLGQSVPVDDEDAVTVFPDIIVHKRRSDKNLLVIEAKKSGNGTDYDKAKVEAFMSDTEYRYQFAALLLFITGEPGGITVTRA